MAGQGGLVGSQIDIAPPSGMPTYQSDVAASTSGRQYLLTWARGNSLVHERAVSADGRFLGEAVSMGQTFATSPAVVGGPMSDFCVAFSDWPNATDFDIYGHLWGIRHCLPLILR